MYVKSTQFCGSSCEQQWSRIISCFLSKYFWNCNARIAIADLYRWLSIRLLLYFVMATFNIQLTGLNLKPIFFLNSRRYFFLSDISIFTSNRIYSFLLWPRKTIAALHLWNFIPEVLYTFFLRYYNKHSSNHLKLIHNLLGYVHYQANPLRYLCKQSNHSG